jgi:hypothetical protein
MELFLAMISFNTTSPMMQLVSERVASTAMPQTMSLLVGLTVL